MEFEPHSSSWLPNATDSFKAPSDDHHSSKKTKKKIKMSAVYCTKCKSLIKEKHLFRIGDHFWHKSCLLCDNCTGQLDDNAYLIDEKLLCHGCYYKSMHAPKCCGCQRLMLSNEYAMYSLNNPYHLTCFKCCVCGNLISKGDRYIVSNGRLICKQDFEATRFQQQQQQQQQQSSAIIPVKQTVPSYPHNNSIGGGNSNIITQTSNGVRKKTKITSEQRLYLERYYIKISNPTIKQRETIAQELNLPAKVIQTWFCNYRTKLKMQRSNGVRLSYDSKHSDDHESNSSTRVKSMLQEQCLTPDQDFPTTNCQISQSTEDHASPQDLSSDLSAGTYTCPAVQHLTSVSQTDYNIRNHQHHNHLSTNVGSHHPTLPPPTSQVNNMHHIHNTHTHLLSKSTNHDNNNSIQSKSITNNAPLISATAITTTVDNNFVLTDLSNSCAKSLEQSILTATGFCHNPATPNNETSSATTTMNMSDIQNNTHNNNISNNQIGSPIVN